MIVQVTPLTPQVQALIDNMENDIRMACRTSLILAAKGAKHDLVDAINFQSFSWKPLTKRWQEEKNQFHRLNKWINTGTLIKNIDIEADYHYVLVGLPLTGTTFPKGKTKNFADYLQTLEDERPLFEPVYNKHMNELLTTNSPLEHYKKMIAGTYSIPTL